MSHSTVTVRVDLDLEEMELAGVTLSEVRDDFEDIDGENVYFEYENWIDVDKAIEKAQQSTCRVLENYVSEQEAEYIVSGGRALKTE